MKGLYILLIAFVIRPGAIAQQPFDILIHEIMADPSPVVGLPNQEYVELRNRSGRDVDLQGWRLATGNAFSAPFNSYILRADSFLILSSISGSSHLAHYGSVLAVGSFPSLPNGGSTLGLQFKDIVIHTVHYSPTWFRDAGKGSGGWSLEMIDADNPCTGAANWRESMDSRGGTPGKKNSVEARNEDLLAPVLTNAYVGDERTIILQFNEPLDKISPGILSHYALDPSIGISRVSSPANMSGEATLHLSAPLQHSTIYMLSLSGIKDCKQNELVKQVTRIGLPEPAVKRDLIINEILFNPKPGGGDFVELYNRSNKIIDAGKLSLQNPNAGRTNPLSAQSKYFFPGDYLLLTEDAESLTRQYFVKDKAALFTVTSLPSMPDDKGSILMADSAGMVIDELSYTDDWHFDLIADDEGVSLERIDPEGPTQQKDNWHSAATHAGYATPTYRNSQYGLKEQMDAGVQLITKIFSPDNDGFDDVAVIAYHFDAPGYVANLKIFDLAGREVRHLVKNHLMGVKGNWTWDGLDEKGKRLPIGPYILFTEVFNLQGKKRKFKSSLVLARKLY